MPLGTVTSLVWTPKNRMLAFLMAFGAGALLAALVIDLVGSARERGHLLELALGSIAGSLFFTTVNGWVNESGGFLRKPSTALAHLTQKQARRLERGLSHLQRLDIFRGLSPPEVGQLASALLTIQYPKGTSLYRQGDPSESLLLDPLADLQPLATLGANDTFGRMAFFTGCSHQTAAVTSADTQLAVLPRPDFERLLQTSPQLVEATQGLIQGQEVADYLQQRHGLTLPQVKAWVSRAVASLGQERSIPDAVPVERQTGEFLRLARQVRRFPLFAHLPLDDLEEIADRLLYRHCEDGYAFFQPQEAADRLFILHQGEVELLCQFWG